MRAIALLGVLCALAGTGFAATRATRAGATSTAAESAHVSPVVTGIERYRRDVWHWQRITKTPLTRSADSAARSPDPRYRDWVLRLWRARDARARAHAVRWLTARARAYEATVTHWDRVMRVAAPRTRSLQAVGTTVWTALRRYRLWQRRAHAVLRRAEHPPYAAQFRCIHRFEGSWTDSGGPYWGGLQMSLTFQRRYGAYLFRTKGTADHWTPLEQLWVAGRAAAGGRGFYPWPNTARICGLL